MMLTMKRTWKQTIGLILAMVFLIVLFGSKPMQALDASAVHDPFTAMFDSDVLISNELLSFASADDFLSYSMDDTITQIHQEQ
jgi:hypothetical protein